MKDYRGTCLTRHYIRADAVEAVVEMELRRLAERLQNPLFAGCTLGGCEILPFMKRWWVIPEAGAKRVSGGRKADLPALSGGRTAVLPHKLKRLLTAAEDDC